VGGGGGGGGGVGGGGVGGGGGGGGGGAGGGGVCGSGGLGWGGGGGGIGAHVPARRCKRRLATEEGTPVPKKTENKFSRFFVVFGVFRGFGFVAL